MIPELNTTLLTITALSSGEEARLLGIKLLNVDDFLSLLLRFSLNFLVVGLIVRGLYYRRSRRLDYVFTYFLLSTSVFLLCFLLESVKLELGFALGLFAIFGILRYRTDPIPIKEMSYLFVVISISVINALSNKKVSYAELIFSNLVIVGLLAAFERVWFVAHEKQQAILYERIELIRPERRAELIEDLRARTGLQVTRVEVGTISLLRDTAELTVFYAPHES